MRSTRHAAQAYLDWKAIGLSTEEMAYLRGTTVEAVEKTLARADAAQDAGEWTPKPANDWFAPEWEPEPDDELEASY